MEPVIEMYSINNPRTPEGGWKDETGCEICGEVSSAYVGIQEKSNMAIVICKGCLLKGIGMIDKKILGQTKTRV